MAEMYPEKFPALIGKSERRRKSAEKRIYECLSKHLPQSFTAFWSVTWLAKRRSGGASDAEADFVVIHPVHGVLIIEVKGGSINRDGKVWTSTNSDGETHVIDPFNQVKNQYYSLKNKMKESPLTAPYAYPIARAVWFPNLRIDSIDLGLDAPREMILDARDIPDPQVGILRAFEYFAREGANSGRSSGASLSQPAIDSLIRLLGTTFEIRTPLAAAFLEKQEEIRRLTDEQFTVLDELAGLRRACISGIAGSGKTMLAIEKARRLANEGYKVLLTCYNSHLANFLARSLAGEMGITVCTFLRLCEAYVDKARIDVRQLRDAPEYFDQILPEKLMEALSRVVTRFDAIIIDEGQDFAENWWIPLQCTLSDPDDGIMYIFFDDNQRIFADRLASFPFKEPLYHLTVNCRNTQSIHRTVRQYYRGNYQLACQGAEGRDVEIRKVGPTAEAAQRELRQILHELVIVNKVPAEDIIVLTPIRKNTIWQEGTSLGNFTLTWISGTRYPNPVLCSTIQSFKGLERAVVIVTEMDKAWGDVDALNYVALSRATNHLIILEQS